MDDPVAIDATLPRCAWVGSDPLSLAYHDREWGVPVHDDLHLFFRWRELGEGIE